MRVPMSRLQCLQAVRDAGLLVFDLKPNSFVWDTAAHRVLMVDFNSCTEGPQGRCLATTRPWSAPEVLQTPWTGDVRSDVYSLGRVFMQMAVRWFARKLRVVFRVSDHSGVC